MKSTTTAKKIICMLLCLLIAAAMPVYGSADVPANGEVPSDDVPYGLSYRFVTFDTIEITAYNGYESVLTVPSYIDGFKVVGIKDFHTVYQYSDFSPGLKRSSCPRRSHTSPTRPLRTAITPKSSFGA